MAGSENHRLMRRRKSDRDPLHEEVHIDVQQCPMTPDGVQKLMNTQEEILNRLGKIEQTMFAGRVALSTATVIAVGALSTFEWFRSHMSSIKDFMHK